LPRIKGEELVNVLKKDGFELVRVKGSHYILQKEFVDGKITIPVPVKKGKDLRTGTLRDIMRRAKISVERLIELLAII